MSRKDLEKKLLKSAQKANEVIPQKQKAILQDEYLKN